MRPVPPWIYLLLACLAGVIGISGWLVAVRRPGAYGSDGSSGTDLVGASSTDVETAAHGASVFQLTDDSDVLSQLSHACEAMAAAARASVVHITSSELRPANVPSPQVREAYGLPEEVRLPGGLGSGTVIRRDGSILTNEHVIRGIDRLEVILGDGSQHPARKIAEDRTLDLALLRIDRNLPALNWGDSDALRPGTWVAALGSPYRGLEGSVTWGMLSGPQRNLGAGPYQNLLQTNTVIHPGFSGGPLINSQGQLVGIHVAIVGNSAQGLSLAIPANRIRETVERMLGPDPSQP